MGKDVLEIKYNCPFCGGIPELYVQKEGWMQSYAVAFVTCPKCKARGPRFESSIMNDQLKLDAVDGWNYAVVFQ